MVTAKCQWSKPDPFEMKVEVTTNPLNDDDRSSEWGGISRRSLLTSTVSAVALAPVAAAGQLGEATKCLRIRKPRSI